MNSAYHYTRADLGDPAGHSRTHNLLMLP